VAIGVVVEGIGGEVVVISALVVVIVVVAKNKLHS